MILVAITVAGILVAGAWVAAPLIQRQQGSPVPASDERLNDLMEAKQAVLRSILDLEFDRKMDKVSPEDYQVMRAQHEHEALGIIEEIDKAGWTTDALEVEIAAARDRLRR